VKRETSAHLPEDEEDGKDDERDVRNDKVARVPVTVKEHGVTVEDDDEDDPEEAKVAGIGLERRLEGEVVARDALVLEAVVEADVAQVDARPGNETGDG